MGDSRVDESSLAESSCFGMDGDTLMAKMDLFGKFRFLIPAQLESLREYEQHIISLRRDNLQLRLRLYFLVKQDQYDPTESNPETAAQLAELHEIVDTETKKISEALKERDALLDRYRKKVDELEQLLERAYQDKSEIDKELNKWKRVTNGCCAHGDGVQDDKHNNELEGEVKGQRFGELEDKDILSQKPKVKSKTKTQQLVSVHALKLEKTGESPNSQEVMWSSVQPRVEAFLQLIDDSLAAGDIEQARQAKEDFKRQLSTIADTCCSSLSLSQCPQEFEAQCSTTMQRRSQMSRFEAGPCNENTMEIAKSRYPSRSAGNHFVVPNTVTVRRGERSSLEAGYGNERLIDSLNNEIMHLKSRLHASQTRRRQLEVEVRSASQLHDTVCKQKDKLLESANMEIHELKRQAKEALVLKSRQAELESECNCLHAAIREKASFIEELLSERNKAVEETEKTLQDFLTSFKQKDESIKELEAKLNHFQKEAATPEKLIVRQQNLTDFSYEPRESLPAPYSVESTPERGGKVFFFASPTSPDGSDTATVLYLSQCTSEVKDLCQAVCELAQESKVLPELSTFNFPNSGTVPELIEILNSARERGLQFCMPSQSGVVNDEHLEDTGHVHNGPDASQVAVPIDLGEKLQQLSLLLGVEYSVLPVCLMDVVGVVDALIGKAKRESIHNSKDPAAFPGDPRPLKGQGQAACSTSNNMTSPHLSNECGNSEAADYQKELLGELDSALECVGELQSEVEALSLTPTTSMLKKTAGSTDELVFAVDSTGQLIPVPLDSVKRNEHFAMETSVQTEEADDDMESLRNELRNAKAQVKFLQRSLKDSFSVKITESPTGPNAQPLIEIDQNLPHHGSLASQSPRKSALSANRRWRKQLTNQKMSEFGLSENVFELQEEIFFLVLRIEDLERQLKESSEVMVSKHKDEPAAYEQSVLTDADLLEKNAALEQQLQDMQEMSVVLLCRLEELAKFLGQLLAYDETGSLGSVTLSSAMVAKIRQFVADSKEMSNSFHSFSLSFLGSDTSSILSDHLSKRGSLDKTMQSFLSLSRKSKDETADMNKPSTGKLDVKMIPPSPEDFAFMEDELKMLRDRVEQQQSEISTLTRRLEEECPERASSATGGCSKRATPASYIKTREFEKLLRRIQQCGSRLEDTLALHKESCQKLLETALGESPKDATESRQLKQTDLLESHGNSMRKLEFRLEEMFINNQVLQELLTEHLASEKAVVAEASTPSGVGADARVNATEQLNQCKKELECKERREEILKRAIVREQNSKLHLEKELADSQKELQSIHEAHRILQEDYKALVERRADSITREPQHHLSLERLDGPTRLEQTKSSSIEKPNSEQAVVCDDNCVLVARVQQQAQEIARLGKEEVLLRDKVMNLLEEKAVLLQKLETAQHEHEVLAESTSNKISELVTKLGPLSTQNKNQQDEIKGLRERCDSLSREKVNLEFDIDRAFSKLEGLRVENQDLRDTLLALRKQESQLQEKLEKAMNELQATKKISDEFSQSDKLLRVEKDQLAAKIADLSSHVDGLQCEKQSLYEEKQRLILEVSAGEDEVERITSKLQNCEEECNNLRTQKIELEAVLQASTEKLEEYERLSEQLREEISATKLKLENMNSRCNHLEQELGASKEAHRQLMWRNDELQRTLEAVGREAQQSKSFLKMNADKQHMMAIAELDRKKSLQSAVTELELKLEKAMHENKCLRFELKAKEQFQVGSTSGAGNSNTSDASLRYISAVSSSSPPRLSPHQATPDSSLRQPVTPLGACRHSTSQSRSQHTSPDLGIDSDPTPEHEFYSAHADSMIVFKEHWQHRMRADWSFSTVHSAPDSIGGNCQPCQQGKDNASLWKLKANATCPAGDLLDRSDSQSPSKSGLPAMSCSFSSPGIRMCAIVQLSDHEQLKKRVDESICLIRRVEGVVEKALDALADFASDCTEPPECKSLLEDAEKGCQTIKGCLTDSFRLICSFTIAPVPEQSAFEQLQLELCKLREKDIKQTAELQSAHEEIAAFKEKKEGMEKAISRQLNKTKMVLKQTRGNLTSMRSRDCNPEKDPKAERNSKAEKK
ncbi:rootletin-like isoform X5 [Dermacentor silvarum]|uniref:rootletin-like isoform X5 n=1 Tax=Dermacentor silvarum TaxID=543639 RepID=UPI002100ECFB|nr:rootletin-like isoform X5 [Dermacentor silvarum]